eukprot:s247_g37.t1
MVDFNSVVHYININITSLASHLGCSSDCIPLRLGQSGPHLRPVESMRLAEERRVSCVTNHSWQDLFLELLW